MKQYLEVLKDVLENGNEKDDRTGTGTLSLFAKTMRFDLSKGFPLVTTKKVYFNAILHELLWFIQGTTNIEYLKKNNVNIWNEWAHFNEVGPMYGAQLRKWNKSKEGETNTADQLADVIHSIKKNPDSRRHVMTTWNVSDLPYESRTPQINVSYGKMALAPCHGIAIQFYVQGGKLSCSMYQRSADMFLGVPFDIASYAILTQMIAQLCELEVGELIITLGDTHIYKNHIEQVQLQLSREPKELPSLIIANRNDIDDFVFEDFELRDYKHHERIKGAVSV